MCITAPPSFPASIETVGCTGARSSTTNHRSWPCGTSRALVTGVLKCTVTRAFVLLRRLTLAPLRTYVTVPLAVLVS